MKFEDFRKKVADLPYFRSNIFPHLTNKPGVLRRQLVDWVKQGRVHILKRGVYTLSEENRNVKFSTFYLAEQLYHPSYISLETALSYYGLIPEGVRAITSITTKKTAQFENKFGQFIYRHIKLSSYGGFITVLDEFGNAFNIADRERALIDYFYFQCRSLSEFDSDIFMESFRLQNIERLRRKRLQEYSDMYQYRKLSKLTNLFIEQLEA